MKFLLPFNKFNEIKVICIFVSCFFLCLTANALINKNSLLTPEQEEALNPTAREHYTQALKFIDKANNGIALNYLEKAFTAQSDYAPLNFLLARLSVEQARNSFDKSSIINYDLAEKVLQATLNIKELSFIDRQRADNGLKMIKDERTKVPQRDALRKEVGLIFIKEQLKYRQQSEDALAKSRIKNQEKETSRVQSTDRGSSAPSGVF